MQSFREPSTLSFPELAVFLPLAANVTLSVGTLPLLVLLTAGRVVNRSVIQLGLASEELFRGDRLPPRPLINE